MKKKEKRREPILISDIVEASSNSPELMGKELEFPMRQEVNSANFAPYVRQILKIVGHPEAFVSDETIIEHFLPEDVEGKDSRELIENLSKKLGFQVKEDDFLVDVAKRLKAKKEN